MSQDKAPVHLDTLWSPPVPPGCQDSERHSLSLCSLNGKRVENEKHLWEALNTSGHSGGKKWNLNLVSTAKFQEYAYKFGFSGVIYLFLCCCSVKCSENWSSVLWLTKPYFIYHNLCIFRFYGHIQNPLLCSCLKCIWLQCAGKIAWYKKMSMEFKDRSWIPMPI